MNFAECARSNCLQRPRRRVVSYIFLLQPLAALCLVAFTASAIAGVSVDYVKPEQFADARLDTRYPPQEQNRVLVEIRGYLVALGARCIRPDQSLNILVRDIDLAGRQEWWHRGDDGQVRVLRGVSDPRMELEYEWRASDGLILATGVDRLSDLNYIGQGTRALASNDSLYYEKALLTEWFDRRFCKPNKNAEQ